MFLGIPPGYRNDLDTANAVSTFGQYHYWNNNDPILDRVLVYASFPSPQLVPRDVLFGKFATVGGARENWTAPVYILMADFAGALPADEDPMPLDGNPHPWPGLLQHDLNMFGVPQYPEIGWDAVPQDHNPANDHVQPDVNENVNNNQAEDQDVQESMVLNLSENSGSSVSMNSFDQDLVVLQQQVNAAIHVDRLQVGPVITVFGPALPPDMLWSRLFQQLHPLYSTLKIPYSLPIPPFSFLKRNWEVAFDIGATARSYSPVIQSDIGERIVATPRRRSVARALSFDNVETSLAPPVFAASPLLAKQRKPRKKHLYVRPEERRFTRSSLNQDGFRPKPVLSAPDRPKKKARAKFLLPAPTDEVEGNVPTDVPDGFATQEEEPPLAATPISLLQRVGRGLGIDPAKLTKEQLDVEPESTVTDKMVNDDD
jgi:hypothetical protein